MVASYGPIGAFSREAYMVRGGRILKPVMASGDQS